MNGYKAFYKGKTVEVHAETKYAAQKQAAILLKAKHAWDVAIELCEKDGKQVTHIPTE